MKSILVELQCPYCGYKTHKKSEQFIVSQFESKFRKKILQDEFFHQDCPRCHRQLSFLHTCLYQDHQHKFMILLEPQKNDKEPEFEEDTKMVKRLVSNNLDFQEKIRILEDELSDIGIEWIKCKMRKKLNLLEGNYIQYHDYDMESNTLWFKVNRQESELVAISKEYYNHFLNAHLNIEKSIKFIKVDENYIKELMRTQ